MSLHKLALQVEEIAYFPPESNTRTRIFRFTAMSRVNKWELRSARCSKTTLRVDRVTWRSAYELSQIINLDLIEIIVVPRAANSGDSIVRISAFVKICISTMRRKRKRKRNTQETRKIHKGDDLTISRASRDTISDVSGCIYTSGHYFSRAPRKHTKYAAA